MQPEENHLVNVSHRV